MPTSYVFVKAQFLQTTWPSKKLAEKYLGPFEVIAQVGLRSYTLQLPDSMRAVHPVFHVSMLEPSVPNSIPERTHSPPPPVEINGEAEYEISKILDSKTNRCRRPCYLLYRVRWAGYEGTDEEMSWVLVTEIVTDFHSAYPAKPGPWPLSNFSVFFDSLHGWFIS
jgi:hypothetical protein